MIDINCSDEDYEALCDLLASQPTVVLKDGSSVVLDEPICGGWWRTLDGKEVSQSQFSTINGRSWQW